MEKLSAKNKRRTMETFSDIFFDGESIGRKPDTAKYPLPPQLLTSPVRSHQSRDIRDTIPEFSQFSPQRFCQPTAGTIVRGTLRLK